MIEPREIPQKLSSVKGHPWYNGFACANVEIWFNGIKQKWVTEYELSKNQITRYRVTAFGVPKINRFGIIQSETLQGKLEVKWKADA